MPGDSPHPEVLNDSTGQLRPTFLDPRSIPVPEAVRQEQDAIRWRPSDTEVMPVSEELLSDFLSLGDTDDDSADIVLFVETWGGLKLCGAHSLPEGHLEPDLTPCWEFRHQEEEYVEPLRVWRAFVKQARLLAAIAENLHAGRVGRTGEWKALREAWIGQDGMQGVISSLVLDPAENARATSASPGRVDRERSILAEIVNTWLRLGAVMPCFHWHSPNMESPEITLGGEGLFGNLAVQLFWALSARDAPTVCSACRLPYDAKRRPRGGESHYCPKCRGRGLPVRDAKRRYNLRRRIETRRQQGRSLPQIGEELGMDVPELRSALRLRHRMKKGHRSA